MHESFVNYRMAHKTIHSLDTPARPRCNIEYYFMSKNTLNKRFSLREFSRKPQYITRVTTPQKLRGQYDRRKITLTRYTLSVVTIRVKGF